MATLTAVDLLIETAKSAASLKDVKKALSDIKALAVQIGSEDKDFNRLAEAAGNLNSKIAAVNDRINTLNPGKFALFESAAQTGAAGIQVFTGAMALFGEQSEDTQKALLKVQAAMAFSQGIAGLKGLGDEFKKLWAVVRQNPITAIVATVAALGVAFYEVYQQMTATSERTKELNAEYEKQQKITEKLVQTYDREIELMQAQGKSEQEVIAVKRKKIEVQLLEAEASLRTHASRVQDVIDNDSLYESTLKVVSAINRKLGATEEAEKAEAEIQKNKQERAGEDLKAAEDALKNIGDLRNQLLVLDAQEDKANVEQGKKRNEEKLKEYTEDAKNHTAYVNAKHAAEEAALKQQREDRKNAYLEAEAQRLEDLKNHLAYVDAKHAAEEQYLKLRKANEQRAYQERIGAQQAFAQASIGILSALEGLARKGSAASKVLALADIAANTAVGFVQGLNIAQKSAEATGPAAAFAFPIFYASQIAAVLGAAAKARDILKGGSTGGGGGPSAMGDAGGGGFDGNALRVINTDPTTTQPTSQFDQNGNPVTPPPPVIIQNNIVESEIQAVANRVNIIEQYATAR